MPTEKTRGRKSWPPIKAKFLDTFRADWEQAKRTQTISLFYDRFAASFIARFGYDLLPYEDPPVEPLENVIQRVETERVPGLNEVDDSEAVRRTKFFDTMRTRLSVWCSHHFPKLDDSAFKGETNALFRELTTVETASTRSKTDLAMYQALHYQERVLPTYRERWAAAVQEAATKNEKPPSPMSVRQRVVRECWEAESEDIRAAVREAVKQDKAARVAEVLDDQRPPATPEDYQHRLDHCAPFVKAIAEGLRQRTGLVVSVLLAGPIPSKGGQIGLRSYHAGTTNDVTPRNWPQYDSAGFGQAEASIISFASRMFPPSERQRRALVSSTSSSRAHTPPSLVESSDESSTVAIPDREPAPGALSNPDPEPEPEPEPGESAPEPEPEPEPVPAAAASPPTVSPPPQVSSATTTNQEPPASSTPTAITTKSVPSRLATRSSSARSTSTPQPRVPTSSAPAATPLHLSAASSTSACTPTIEPSNTIDSLPLRLLHEVSCPGPLKNAYTVLAVAEFDIAWTDCVAAFIRLQAKSGFRNLKGAKLPLAGRPEEFKTWFKEGRASDGPEIMAHSTFLRELESWWWSLQPAVRGKSGRDRTASCDWADYETVLVPGLNGIFLVLCGLLWVGLAIFEHGEDALLPQWSSLVEDVTWVLLRNVEPVFEDKNSSSKKRAVDHPSTRPTKRRRA